ncbi:MAG: hypothetical protein K2Y56_12920 [Methylobacterium sp.]|uniref:hypothetical protein n=1 Tax=Methylobacterium sp. TaxID=409 RepID=UPI0025D8B7EE|nr:hypothetical protein [Methylobacterium sp.]MBX9932422.1 hypothetical protein [Methylobacterium sp.]
MDNIIRPAFGKPREARAAIDSRVEVTTERVYGEANGYRVCLVRDEDAVEGSVLKVVVGKLSGMEVSTVAVLAAGSEGEVDAELVALAILRTLSLVEVEAVSPSA